MGCPSRHPLASLPLPPNSASSKKKALLIGINYQFLPAKCKDDAPHQTNTHEDVIEMLRTKSSYEGPEIFVTRLRGCQRNALDMQKFLIDNYQYKHEDTVVLIDEEGYLQPTRNNILNAIDKLVDGAQPGDHFFFHYSGHAQQWETNNIDEEDGKDESIISIDGQPILDDELRKRLVDPLPIGSHLTAVLDSCHSGTLLDLPHIKCNRVYVPWISKGPRGSATMQMPIVRKQEMWEYSTAKIQHHRSQALIDEVIHPLKKNKDTTWYGTPASPIPRCQSPSEMFCSGHCVKPSNTTKTKADVISISAAKDSQQAWENQNGESMTQALLHNLSKDLHPRLRTLVQAISHNLHKSYVRLHSEGRRYRKNVHKYNAQGKELGRPPICRQYVEMVNFQDPQVSSHHPLDMNATRWNP